MSTLLLEAPIRRWQCPDCGRQHVTQEARVHTPLHNCTAHALFLTPFVEVHGAELSKKDGVLRFTEREDFISSEIVRTDAEGRPQMAIDTVRPDGSYDRAVYAPTAVVEFPPNWRR